MKAIILAAGEGTRARPLTTTTPKPLLKILGRPILDYVFDSFPEEITEVVLVVRYLGEQIKRHLGTQYRGKEIFYVEGSDRGTAHSFLAVRHLINPGERFLVVHGDEFPYHGDVRACLQFPLSTVVTYYDQPRKAGVVTMDKNGYIQDIIEKPENPQSNTVVGGIMVLDENIFSYAPVPNVKGEFYLSSMLNQYAKDHRVKAVFAEQFAGDITTPADIERVETFIMKKHSQK